MEMIRLQIIIASLTMGILVANCKERKGWELDIEDEQGLKGRFVEAFAKWNSNNPQAYVSVMDEDIRVWPEYGPVLMGKSELMQYFMANFPRYGQLVVDDDSLYTEKLGPKLIWVRLDVTASYTGLKYNQWQLWEQKEGNWYQLKVGWTPKENPNA